MERQHYQGIGGRGGRDLEGRTQTFGHEGGLEVGHGAGLEGHGPSRAEIAHRPTSELVRDGLDQAKRLLREEAHLITADLKVQARTAAKGLGTAAAGGVVLLAGFFTLVAMVVMALANVMAGWLAALITGVALLVVGGIMAWGGVKRAREARPDQSIQSLEEDKRWASETMHAMKSRTRANA